TSGDRLELFTLTAASTNNDGSVTDTVVTLWDPSQRAIAQDDDAWPRTSTDSQLFVNVPTTGEYYITVEDCISAFGGSRCTTATITDLHYTLYIDHLPTSSYPDLNAAAAQDGTIAHAQSVTYRLPPN